MSTLKYLEEYENDVGLDPEITPPDAECDENGPRWLWVRVFADEAPANASDYRSVLPGHEDPKGRSQQLSPTPPQDISNERALPLFLTPDEAAKVMRLSGRKALYAQIERGQVAGVVRMGSRILLDRDILMQSLRAKSGRSR